MPHAGLLDHRLDLPAPTLRVPERADWRAETRVLRTAAFRQVGGFNPRLWKQICDFWKHRSVRLPRAATRVEAPDALIGYRFAHYSR